MRFSVIGAGSWGTTLAHLFGLNGHQVRLWALEPEVVEGINNRHQNPFFVPDLSLSANVEATIDLDFACGNPDGVLFAVPSNHLRTVAKKIAPALKNCPRILNAAKGLEHDSGKRLSEVLAEALGDQVDSESDRVANDRVAIL